VTRGGDAAFEHHGELARVAMTGARGDAEATVFVGGFAGVASPARRDWESFGAEVAVRGAVDVPLVAAHEHLVVVIDGAVAVDGTAIAPGVHAYLAPGRDGATLQSADDARVLLLGGVPFPEPIEMWWNFVARSRQELGEAWRQWSDGAPRFPSVASPLPRTEVAPPPWL
jgi:redox-sensitive bicupin YhaK (pirin superfamily)